MHNGAQRCTVGLGPCLAQRNCTAFLPTVHGAQQRKKKKNFLLFSLLCTVHRCQKCCTITLYLTGAEPDCAPLCTVVHRWRPIPNKSPILLWEKSKCAPSIHQSVSISLLNPLYLYGKMAASADSSREAGVPELPLGGSRELSMKLARQAQAGLLAVHHGPEACASEEG